MSRILVACLIACQSTGTLSAHAQVIGDWNLIHSGRAFDYLVTERGFGEVKLESGGRALRVTVSRMLVRHIDEGRQAVAAARGGGARNAVSWAAYGSSTYLLDVIACDGESLVAIIEVTDYDDSGQILFRTRPSPEWVKTIDEWDEGATRRLMNWACSHGAGDSGGDRTTA